MNSEELRVKSTERKRSEGITLIALVITIIVLLILAVVSVQIITNQGIIGHAENATERYTAEQEKELIGLAHADYKMSRMNNTDYTMQDALDNEQAGAIAEGDETSGWTITFNNSGNQYTLTNDGTITPVSTEVGNEGGTDAWDCSANGHYWCMNANVHGYSDVYICKYCYKTATTPLGGEDHSDEKFSAP